MGKVVSRVANTVFAEFRNYNIEQRAHKVVSQSKPKPAPKFESNLKDLERVLKDHPEIVDETSRKDKDLDDRLKNVFVTTSHIVDQKRIVNPERPLPLNKEFVGFFELGYKEPEFITPGKATLRQLIQFLGDHRLNKDEWTAEKIALEYKLSLEDVKNLLEYYKLFAMHIPSKDDKKKRPLLKTEYDTQKFKELINDSTAKYLPEDEKKKN